MDKYTNMYERGRYQSEDHCGNRKRFLTRKRKGSNNKGRWITGCVRLRYLAKLSEEEFGRKIAKLRIKIGKINQVRGGGGVRNDKMREIVKMCWKDNIKDDEDDQLLPRLFPRVIVCKFF